MTEIYILSLYWICEVLTTVGYGDFSGSTGEELFFSMFLEFGGLLLFSILTGLLVQYLAPGESYEQMLSQFVEDGDLWVLRLEAAANTDGAGRSSHCQIDSKLYRKISISAEEAFKHDFNLIVESAGFY